MPEVRKRKEQYLRVMNDKIIYLTSGASACIGDRVDIYECGQVVALASSTSGLFHTGKKSKGCNGKNISSKDLVTYLQQKFRVEIGGRLPVWQGYEHENVLYLDSAGYRKDFVYSMDERFTKVELEYHKRHGEWVYIEDNGLYFTSGIRNNLPRRLALYGDKETLALFRADGPYALEYRSGRKGGAVYSRQLAEYCKARFHGDGRSLLLHAVPMENGVRFALDESALLAQQQPDQLQKIDLGASRDAFITLLKNKTIYISAKSVQILGSCINLYAAGRFLAFKSEPRGCLAVANLNQHKLIHSVCLINELRLRYPGADKLFLVAHGDLMALVSNFAETDLLPNPDQFRPLPIPTRNNGGPVSNHERWLRKKQINSLAK